MIKLTHSEGFPIWISAWNVVELRDESGRTAIYLTNGTTLVTEAPDFVAKRINSEMRNIHQTPNYTP